MLLKRVSIDELLDHVGNLPPMPQVAMKAMEIIRDPTSNMSDLANVIKIDQAMSSLILRWVNSGYYSLRHHVVSIEQAVAYLGQRTVQNLVLTASISKFMNRPIAGYAMEGGDLWKHSVGMAAAAKLLIRDVAPSRQEDAYYAGLFCDVGKLAFEVLLKDLKFDLTKFGDRTFDNVEKELFGYDHSSVSAAMIQRWNLPDYLSEIVLNHHTPDNVQGESRPLAFAVHAADATMMLFGVGIGRDALQYQLHEKTPEVLKFDESSLDMLYSRVLPVIEEAESFVAK